MIDDAYTVSLTHGDGSDGSQVIPDGGNFNWNVIGNTQIDTAQSVFGGASVLFDGTGDSLWHDYSADYAFASNALTIDFRIRFNAFPAVSTWMFPYSQRVSETDRFCFGLYNDAGVYKWGLLLDAIAIYFVPTIALSTWYHTALIRIGNDWIVTQDGVQVGTNQTQATAADSAGPIRMGTYTGTDHCFNGWIDEHRVSKGIARWTTFPFTPDAGAYADAIRRPTRVSKVATMVEWEYPQKRRVSKVATMVEWKYPQKRRVSNIATMVETRTLVFVDDPPQGPRVGWM